VAEYEALVNDPRIAAVLGVKWLYINGNSELIMNQVMGESNSCDSCMAAYRQEVRKLGKKFDGFKLHHIVQQDNKAADALTRFGSSREQPPPGVFMQDLIKPFIRLYECSPVTMVGTPPGEGGLTPTLETSLRTLTGPAGQAQEPGLEIAAVTGPSSSETN
jgi:hypothetical protein